jgi:hypothetical protein
MTNEMMITRKSKKRKKFFAKKKRGINMKIKTIKGTSRGSQ